MYEGGGVGDMRKRNVQFKITASAVVCFIIGVLLILCTLFFYLQSVFTDQSREVFRERGERYANIIKDQFEKPISFLAGVTNMAEAQMESGAVDRVALKELLFHTFDEYTLSEGTAFMIEPNAYDGLDSQYINSAYGTKFTGRISYYYYRDENGKTQVQPQTEEDEREFVQPYYLMAAEQKIPTYTEPYLYTVDGHTKFMITASYPMINDAGALLGVMTVDFYLDSLSDFLSKEKIYDTGYIVVVSEDGNILYSPDIENAGKNAKEAGVAYPLPEDEGTARYAKAKSAINGKESTATTVAVRIAETNSVFYVSIVVPNSETNAVYIRLLMIMSGMFILVGLIMVFVISHRMKVILKPLHVMTNLIRHYGETGSLTYSEEDWQRTHEAVSVDDDIGRSLKLILEMFGRLVYYGTSMQSVAERNIAIEVDTLSSDDTIGNALNTMICNLNEMLGRISDTSGRIESLSYDVSQGSQRTASGAVDQSDGANRLSESVSSVYAQTKKNATGAEEVLAFTQQSGEMLSQSTRDIEQMNIAMNSISKASHDIMGIVGVIDDIAFQTNILALNAAVEAAHAGSSGKGFSVVADEVRSLAGRATEAARMTVELIEKSLAIVDEGIRLSKITEENIRKAAEHSMKTLEKIERIAEASKKQEESISQINMDIGRISAIITENTEGARNAAKQSESLSDQAKTLTSIIAGFKLKS
jgi:methyl-accepting chemotaxis protein